MAPVLSTGKVLKLQSRSWFGSSENSLNVRFGGTQLRRSRQEDQEVKASLGQRIVGLCVTIVLWSTDLLRPK